MELFDRMHKILKTPFVGDLDLLQIFLLVGLVMIFVIAWGIFLNQMKEVGAELTQ